MSRIKSIPVIDGKGDQLIVYEFYDGRFLQKIRRRRLCTGEAVERVSTEAFVIIATGEELRRI